MAPPLIQVIDLGFHEGNRYQNLRFNLHPGQRKTIASKKRWILVLSGWRSGKTVTGPLWLFNEMKDKGPGDYLIATPDFALAAKKVAPEVEHVLSRLFKLGKMVSHPLEYRISKQGEQTLWPGQNIERPSRIIFGHADDPDSLASMQVKAAWLDEPGQKKFKLGSWEEIRARLAIDTGRCLMTSRPYCLNWLKDLFYDPWEKAKRNHPEIDVINYASTMNPAFPKEEAEQAQRELPLWKYRMLYLGQWERPAGMIYDKFDTAKHVWPRFAIPVHWPRYVGLDFGGVNTAAVYLAAECTPTGKPMTDSSELNTGAGKPTGRFFAYREYYPRESRSAKDHAAALLGSSGRPGDRNFIPPEPRLPMCLGGSRSEGQWRLEFAQAGLPIHQPPIHGPDSVEVGINRMYKLIAEDRLIVFEDLSRFREELGGYSRELDAKGEPTEDIEDKETYHTCFVAGTMIETINGHYPIESVGIGDLVLTRQGYFPVSALMRREDRPLRRLEISNGRELIGTPDHPIFVNGKGFCGLDTLRYGDTLISPSKKYAPDAAKSTLFSSPKSRTLTARIIAAPELGETGEMTTSTEIAIIAGPSSERIGMEKKDSASVHAMSVSDAGRGTVFNLMVDGPHEYFANGVLVSNCDAARYLATYLAVPRNAEVLFSNR